MQRSAIIIGTSGGIGGALADCVDARGTHNVYRLGRSGPISIDLTDEATIMSAATQLKETECSAEYFVRDADGASFCPILHY